MPRGRKEKPAALRQAQGNPGKRRIVEPQGAPELEAQAPAPVRDDERTAFASDNVHEQSPVHDEFPPPVHLSDEEKEIWRAEIQRIGALNLLRHSDTSAFEIYVSTLWMYRKAKAVIAEHGLTYVSASKHGEFTRLRPEAMQMSRCERMILNFQRDLGLTSISRIRAHSIVAATRQPTQGVLPLPGGSNSKGDDVKATGATPTSGPLGALRTQAPQGHA